LVKLEQIKASQQVGTTMGEALAKAEIKIISNGGGEILNGVTRLTDMFTTGGGTNIAGMLSALSQTAEGKALVNRIGGVAKEA
jgi:hypothetical protein